MKLALLFLLVALRSVVVMAVFTALAVFILTVLSMRLSVVERWEGRLSNA